MGRSQETFGKKGVRTKNEKKRKEKEQKRALKRSEGKKKSFDDMIAYVDEFGRISSTPPDPDKKTEIAVENIELTATRNTHDNSSVFVRKGVVTFYNESKGFGFIRDLESNQRIFVHANGLLEPVFENNLVIFEIVKGPKGPSAIKVKLHKD
jgi:cold shock CspA family protein